MSHPTYTQDEAIARQTFLALMWSLSYPGKICELPANINPFYAIADTLLDIETSFYTADANFVEYCKRNGARPLTPDRAAYHFYSMLTEDLLDTINQATIGTLMYPDEGATLIIGATFGSGQTLSLSGPGIPQNEKKQIQVAHVPLEFWALREKANRYPRGWDVYLVDAQQVIGLPRTTHITVEE